MTKLNKSNKLVHGVGINDAGYMISKKEYYYEDGKRKSKLMWSCPYYVRWKVMLKRCYSEKSLSNHPTYKDCYVCTEWLTFSNFKDWMEKQDWEGKQLDKDLLGLMSSKTYSPETCCFLDQNVNKFLIFKQSDNTSGFIGVHYDKRRYKWRVQISDPFSNKYINLGRYPTQEEAFSVWKAKKLEYAYELIEKGYLPSKRAEKCLIKIIEEL